MKLLKVCALAGALVFSGVTGVFAQEVEWGQVKKARSKYYNPNIIGEDDKHYYGYSIEGKKIHLEGIKKKDFAKKWEKEIVLPKIKNRKATFEKFYLAGDQILLFASVFDKKNDASEVYAFTISVKNGNMNDKPSSVYSAPAEKKKEAGSFGVYSNREGSKVLVHHLGYDRKQKTYNDAYVLLDGDMNELESTIIEYDKDEDFKIYDLSMDDEGSVYLMKEQNEKVFVMSFDALRGYEKWEEEIQVEFEDSYASIRDVNMKVNLKNEVVIVGSYVTSDLKKKKKKTKVKDTQLGGAFFMRIDKASKETVVSKVSKFDKEFLESFATEKQLAKDKKKKNEAEEDLDHISFFFEEDGGVIVVGEYYNYDQITDHNGNVIGEIWAYGDLVAMHFEEDGTLEWAKRIPKRQRFYWQDAPLLGYIGFMMNPHGLTFMTIPYHYLQYYSYTGDIADGKLYLAFNDHPENVNLKSINAKLKTQGSLNKSVPVVCSIDMESGEYKKETMIKLSSDNMWFKPSFSYRNYDHSKLFVMGQKKKKYKFGMVSFK